VNIASLLDQNVSRKIAQIDVMNWDTIRKAIHVESFAQKSSQPIVILVKCLAQSVLKNKEWAKNVPIGDTAKNTTVVQICVLNLIVSHAMIVNEWDLRVSKKNGYASKCKEFGYNIVENTCYHDPHACPMIYPTKCADCETLGPFCVNQKYRKFCENVGYDIDNNKCDTVDCPALYPNTCEDCVKLGPQCVKQGKHDKLCKSMHWLADINECGLFCTQDYITTCDQCSRSSHECLKKNGDMQRCIDLGYNPKDRTCGGKCITLYPSSCADCVRLGPKCVKSHAERCKSMGWKSKKNKCKRGPGEKCVKKCKTCEACAEQSKECQQKIKFCRKN